MRPFRPCPDAATTPPSHLRLLLPLRLLRIRHHPSLSLHPRCHLLCSLRPRCHLLRSLRLRCRLLRSLRPRCRLLLLLRLRCRLLPSFAPPSSAPPPSSTPLTVSTRPVSPPPARFPPPSAPAPAPPPGVASSTNGVGNRPSSPPPARFPPSFFSCSCSSSRCRFVYEPCGNRPSSPPPARFPPPTSPPANGASSSSCCRPPLRQLGLLPDVCRQLLAVVLLVPLAWVVDPGGVGGVVCCAARGCAAAQRERPHQHRSSFLVAAGFVFFGGFVPGSISCPTVRPVRRESRYSRLPPVQGRLLSAVLRFRPQEGQMGHSHPHTQGLSSSVISLISLISFISLSTLLWLVGWHDPAVGDFAEC